MSWSVKIVLSYTNAYQRYTVDEALSFWWTNDPHGLLEVFVYNVDIVAE